jgi:hypothetical protein
MQDLVGGDAFNRVHPKKNFAGTANLGKSSTGWRSRSLAAADKLVTAFHSAEIANKRGLWFLRKAVVDQLLEEDSGETYLPARLRVFSSVRSSNSSCASCQVLCT